MCAGHAVHAVCHTCQAHNPKLQMSYTPCPNSTHQHPPGRHNCPAQDSACKGCWKKGHWQENVAVLAPLVHKHPVLNPGSRVWKGERNTSCQSQKQRKDPHTETCSLLQWLQNSRDVHPKEMIINNISSQWCNEAYMVIKLPASARSKALPQSMSRLTPGLEATYYPSICPNNCIQNKPPRWPAHWPGHCSNQANCLQWASNSSVWKPHGPILW